MGTRADFYVGRGDNAEWLGSIGWDGYPDGIPPSIKNPSEGEKDYRFAVQAFLNDRDDATLPDQGWPWPWETSHTTDYAYAFDGQTFASCFGGPWFDARFDDDEPVGDTPVFPNMKDIQKVTLGRGSGLMIISA